jgi:hypothetical protein
MDHEHTFAAERRGRRHERSPNFEASRSYMQVGEPYNVKYVYAKGYPRKSLGLVLK